MAASICSNPCHLTHIYICVTVYVAGNTTANMRKHTQVLTLPDVNTCSLSPVCVAVFVLRNTAADTNCTHTHVRTRSLAPLECCGVCLRERNSTNTQTRKSPLCYPCKNALLSPLVCCSVLQCMSQETQEQIYASTSPYSYRREHVLHFPPLCCSVLQCVSQATQQQIPTAHTPM